MAAIQRLASRGLARTLLRPPACTRMLHGTSRWSNTPDRVELYLKGRERTPETPSEDLEFDLVESTPGSHHKSEPIEPDANNIFNRFNLSGGVFAVTGGSSGLGLAMAEALAEAGGKVYCLDQTEQPSDYFTAATKRLLPFNGGDLFYRQVDVRHADNLDKVIGDLAATHFRLDGVIAAAGVQKLSPALDYTPEDVQKVMDVNFVGVFMTANSAARAMLKYRTQGSICLVASMSGLIANKGLICPVYNSSKAAVIQLARSLSMEWAKVQPDGRGGIRVNALSPGHCVTPMAEKDFKRVPGLRDKWEAESHMGRISTPDEFKGAALFLLSKASGFMTGSNLVIDGGHTAW